MNQAKKIPASRAARSAVAPAIRPAATRARPLRLVRPRTAAEMVENVVGCKWSMTVLALVRDGVNRPGAMEHSVPGLSAKVLNERLRKLVRYGILAKRSYPEVPPRVEYHLTDYGRRFSGLLDLVEHLQGELDAKG